MHSPRPREPRRRRAKRADSETHARQPRIAGTPSRPGDAMAEDSVGADLGHDPGAEHVAGDRRGGRIDTERPDTGAFTEYDVAADDGALDRARHQERRQCRSGRYTRGDQDSGRLAVDGGCEVHVAVEVVVDEDVVLNDVAVEVADEVLVDRDARESVADRDVAADHVP